MNAFSVSMRMPKGITFEPKVHFPIPARYSKRLCLACGSTESLANCFWIVWLDVVEIVIETTMDKRREDDDDATSRQ